MQALKGSNEDDVDATLDRVMMLFRYLQEKDVFEKYYKQHLAKRLLSGRAVRPLLLWLTVSHVPQQCPSLVLCEDLPGIPALSSDGKIKYEPLLSQHNSCNEPSKKFPLENAQMVSCSCMLSELEVGATSSVVIESW